MKKFKVLSIILLMLILITGCKQTEQKGNMMKLELNCDAENGYLWQTTILNSNVIKSVGDEFLYKNEDNVEKTVQKITFEAQEAGSAEIEIKYLNTSKEDKDKNYSIKYIVEVDSDLNIKILSKTGKFYENEIITPELYTKVNDNKEESQSSEN